jgi:hypothetical protein
LPDFSHCIPAVSKKINKQDIFFIKLIRADFITDHAKIIPQSYAINDKEALFFDEAKICLEEIPNINRKVYRALPPLRSYKMHFTG